MREFGKSGFVLRRAPRSVRLVYAGFLLLTALGLATEVVMEISRIGVTPSAIAVYYRGGETGDVMTFPKPPGQLLELTHAHAFMMATVFLILAHLFLATSARPPVKIVVLSATFAGLAVGLAAPWLVRYVAPWCAWITLTAWLAQGLGTACLVGISAWECLGAPLHSC